MQSMRTSEVQFVETPELISEKKNKFINFPLKDAIRGAGFTLKSFAKQLDLDAAYLCTLVNNPEKYHPSVLTLEKMCNVLNKTPAEISYKTNFKLQLKIGNMT